MDIKLPKLGEGADSGTVVTLLVKAGDRIEKDQPLIELENEKAVATIPSSAAGTVTKIHVKVGDKIAVGQTVVSLSEGAEGAVASKESEPSQETEAAIEPKRAKEEAPRKPDAPAPESEEEPLAGAPPPAASPSIRKLARDLGIDLRRVTGSERGGRIVMADLRSYIGRLQKRSAASAQTPSPALPKAPVDFSKWGPVRKEPLSSLRQTIARHMVESWSTIPHVTQLDEADITELLKLKKAHDPAYEKRNVRLTLTAILLKIIAALLKRHAKLNASLDESSQAVVYKDYCHLGVAVETPAGLVVPVIRDVDKKSLLDVSRELNELAEKTRQRKVTAEELQGGTFTISNQGGIGGGHFTPIIKKPEAAILGVGRSGSRPLVRSGGLEARVVLPLALSYDHRLIDGADAARFITDLVQALEQPSKALFKADE